MNTFNALAARGKSVFVSMHDLGLAARHCDRIVLLADGEIQADDIPQNALIAQNMEEYFNVRAYAAQTSGGMIFQPFEVV